MTIKFYNSWDFEYFPKSFWFDLFKLDWEFYSPIHSYFQLTICNFQMHIIFKGE